MKKLLLSLCLLASLQAFAQSNSDKLTAAEITANMEKMRSYNWGEGERPLEHYIYSVYRTGTADRAQAAEIEKKAVSELQSLAGNQRYKLLLAQTLEICGIQNSANAVAEIVVKNCAKAENKPWIDRLVTAIGVSEDKSAKDALLKLAKSKCGYVAAGAVTALGYRGEGGAEILAAMKAQMSSGFRDSQMTYASMNALSRLGGDPAVKALFEAYKKASDGALKQSLAEALFTAAAKAKPAVMDGVCSEILNDKNALLGVKIAAYANLVRRGKAPAPASADFTIAAIDVVKRNKSVKIPAFLSLASLDEPLQVLMVEALTARGEGYDEIIKLSPKSSDLAEAVTNAASKMGSDKDYAKLLSFAPLYDKRAAKRAAYYITAIPAENKVVKLNAAAQNGSPEVQSLVAAALDNLDSSSAMDVLLKEVADGDPASKVQALKALGTAQAKSSDVFVKVAGMYPGFKDAPVVSAAQRLMVGASRVACTPEMFKAAVAQYNLAKDAKTKGFFLRFAAPYGGADAAEFLASAYMAGFKNEALREFGNWTNENAFESLKKLEKADGANKAKIRATMVSILKLNNMRESPMIKYISQTASNDMERNLINMIEMPNFGDSQVSTFKNGIKGKATHNNGNLKNAFDGDIGTRWDSSGSRTPGMGVMFELPKAETLKGVELLLGSSGGDRVQAPMVFGGDSMDNMRKLAVKYGKENGKDVIEFEKPQNLKAICIVNTKAQGGYWSIHEVSLMK